MRLSQEHVSKIRARGEEKRKQTLLLDMNSSTKNNVVVDRRLDEYSANLSQDEKILRRFQKQRAVRLAATSL